MSNSRKDLRAEAERILGNAGNKLGCGHSHPRGVTHLEAALRAAEARGRLEAQRDALTGEELAMVLGTLDGAEDSASEEFPGRRIRSGLDSARVKLERQAGRLRALASGNPPKAAPSLAGAEELTPKEKK